MRTPSAETTTPAPFAALALVVALATGCSELPGGNGRLPDDLADARASWRSKLASGYSVTWQQMCLCLADMVRPIQIRVSAGAIASAIYVDDQQPVGQPTRSSLMTIDEVFEVLVEAVEDGAVQVDVDYDPTWSFPVSVYIDYDRRIADEELSLALSDFVAIER
jgi:hypothetical protein